MWQIILRYIAGLLFLVSHSLLVLDHLGMGTVLHGIGEVVFAPWAIRERAWDLVLIALIFGVFDLWGAVKFGVDIFVI